MKSAAIEILFILLLLIANGLFAMSEIALVSSRKARLQRRAEKDDGARVALELAKRYGTAQSSQFVNGILDRLIPGGGKKPGTGETD